MNSALDSLDYTKHITFGNLQVSTSTQGSFSMSFLIILETPLSTSEQSCLFRTCSLHCSHDWLLYATCTLHCSHDCLLYVTCTLHCSHDCLLYVFWFFRNVYAFSQYAKAMIFHENIACFAHSNLLCSFLSCWSLSSLHLDMSSSCIHMHMVCLHI